MKTQTAIHYSVTAINKAHDLAIALDTPETYRRIELTKAKAISALQILSAFATLIGILALSVAIAFIAQSVRAYHWLQQNAPVWRENTLEAIGMIESGVSNAIAIVSLYNPIEVVSVVRHFRAIL